MTRDVLDVGQSSELQADADSIQLDYMVAFYKLLGGGQRDGGMDGSGRLVNRFAIIPDRTHYNLMSSPAVTKSA